jgi:iron complex outermembrane receptor protein
MPGASLALSLCAQPNNPTFTNAPPGTNATPLTSVVVIGHRQPIAEGAVLVPTPEIRARARDTASLLEQIPGAAVVRNGPLTGIAQLRGLSGDRVRVLVDGATITPACPNHMDPPLHYASPSSLHTLTVLAGITPVSQGGDSIGGTVITESAPPRFATNEHTLWSGEAGSFYRSSDDGYGFNGALGVANQNWSGAYQGSWQTADDLRFPGGRVRDTGFDETQQHVGRLAARTKHGVWEAAGGVGRTRDAGTPALPMDMIQDDSWRVGLRHTGEYDFGELEGRVAVHSIDHLMDNFSLRPLAAGAMRMFSPARSDDLSAGLAVALPRAKHTLHGGVEFHGNAFDAYQQNAMSGAQQDTINDATRARLGSYLELQSDWSDRWQTLIGVRNDTVWSDADDIANSFPASAADRASFNARSHNFTDANLDAMVAVRFTPNKYSSYELAFARKNRAPSLLERYLWTPLSASAGQADGRTYLGNLNLDSETSHQVALTADWHGDRWQVKFTPFYNLVSDYIQGTPINRIVSGQPVLQFQNQDRAELYGVDGEAHYDLTKQFTLRGQLSYVRGRNCDRDDDLYRIAPLRGTMRLEHRWRGWRSGLEVELVDRQSQVADYNGELPTPGYTLLHLYAGYTFREHLSVDVALENVFDEKYEDHLGGINRVLGSDVPVGSHIPGAGRFVSVAVNYKF